MRSGTRGWTWTICLTYVAFGLAYNALVPIGESPDEIPHFGYLHLVMEERRLPTGRDDLWQGHQAPLYYLAGATWAQALRGITGCRIEPARLPNQLNPGFPASANYSYLVHAGSERLGSWGCGEWSFHLLRLLSTALTVPTILVTMAILRLAVPGSPATAALGGVITALLPSHVAVSSMLNNDALVNLLIAAATYWVLRGVTSADAAALGKAAVLAGVASAAKLSGLYLFGLVLLALALRRAALPALIRPGPARRWAIAGAAAALLPCLLVARNLAEWGDPFAVSALERNLVKLIRAGMYPTVTDPVHYYVREMPELLANSFMVAYGPVNFRYTGPLDLGRWGPRVVLAGVALSPMVRSAWRRVDRRALGMLAAGFALFFATYAQPGYRYRWLQVRYFFNQLPLISLVAAVAIETLADGARRLGLPVTPGMVVAAVYAGLVALNAMALSYGVVPHLYRYVGGG